VIESLQRQLQEKDDNAEGLCLRDVLGVMKHFLDKNDRKTFIDEVGIVSKK